MKGISFRVGKVRANRRGEVWYLDYHEHGKRHRPRIGKDKTAARQLAAQINSQLEVGAPAALSFEPISLSEVQRRWLDHHEHVLRSSVQTINRYRSATNHLITFLSKSGAPATTSRFGQDDAERFIRHLRALKVAPNGHPNARKRCLLDNGVKYILECCRTMFNYAIKRRHLSPYAENPFGSLDIDRMPMEDSRPIELFTPDQERQFLEKCDNWQFPIFLTLMLTGLRPGELTHLLLPDDVDLEAAMLRVRNKPKLGWQVKTRNEREIPLLDEHVKVLRSYLRERRTGPVFLRRRFLCGEAPLLTGWSFAQLEAEIALRISKTEEEPGAAADRSQRLQIARAIWRDAGAVRTERLRKDFIRLTKAIGLSGWTAPKTLRHMFATCLQDANVDPIIRCELMGHSIGLGRAASHGLGMTATYTHTRTETKRQQLICALLMRPGVAVAIAREPHSVGSRREIANMEHPDPKRSERSEANAPSN